MRFPWRKAAAARKAAGGRADWFGPPRLAERSCCCPARPVVMVLIPPASERRHPVDLLLCGHHYLTSKAALAAAGAVVMDETGAIVDPADRPVRCVLGPAAQRPATSARSRPVRAAGGSVCGGQRRTGQATRRCIQSFPVGWRCWERATGVLDGRPESRRRLMTLVYRRDMPAWRVTR